MGSEVARMGAGDDQADVLERLAQDGEVVAGCVWPGDARYLVGRGVV
jgi:hypothetical protein